MIRQLDPRTNPLYRFLPIDFSGQLCTRCLLSFALFFIFQGIAHCQTGTWNGTSGDWTDVSRWNQANFPDISNGIPNAIINAGSVNLDQNISLTDLTLNGGSILGNNDVSVLGNFVWTGGTMDGTGTTFASQGSLFAASGSLVNNRTLDVSSNFLSWDGGDITGTGQVNIDGGGALFITGTSGSSLSISNDLNVGPSGFFYNASSQTVSITSDNLVADGFVWSTTGGTVDISANNGSGFAQFQADAGSTLRFSGGTHNYQATTSGGGTFQFSGGNVQFSGGGYITNETKIDGGTVGGTMSTVQLDWSSGSIDGAGTTTTQTGMIHGTGGLTLNQDLVLNGGNLNWMSNDISGTGLATFHAGGLIFTGTANQSITNDIQINANGGIQSQTASVLSVNGSQFTNNGFVGSDGGGVVDIASTTGSGSGIFQASSGGKIRISGGNQNYTGTTQGGGRFQFSGGTTSFTGGGYQANETQIDGGTLGGDIMTQVLYWNSGTINGTGTFVTNGGVFNGTGGLTLTQDLTINNGQVNWQSNDIIGTGLLDIDNGAIVVTGSSNRTISSDVRISNGAIQVQTPGTVKLDGSALTLAGTMFVTNGGTLDIATNTGSGTGIFQHDSGTTLRFSSGSHNYSGDIQGGGNVQFNGGVADLTSGNVSGNSISIGANGTLNLAGTPTLVSANTVSNAGQLRISGAADFSGVASAVQNSGLVIVGASGQLVANAYVQTGGETRLIDGSVSNLGTSDFLSGELTGNGEINGNVNIAAGATLAPGASAGILEVISGALDVSGTLELEIGGELVDGASQNANQINSGTVVATTDYDQINVYGNAELFAGTTINVSLINGYAPTPSSFFDVLTADLLTANLGSISFVGPAGFTMSSQIVTLNDPGLGPRDALRLNFSAIPEPSTALLFASAIGFTLCRRRRKAS